MSLGHPYLVWLPVALPALLFLGALVERRRRRKLARHQDPGGPGEALGLVHQEGGEGGRARNPWLTGACGVLVGLGAAGLQWEPTEEEGTDAVQEVILVLDVSRSMTVADVPPNRLEVARRIGSRAVLEFSGRPLGLVTFAGDAYTLLPPTRDRSLVSLYLGMLDPGMVSGQGSSLSRAILEALALTDDQPHRGSGAPERAEEGIAILVISDGEVHGNETAVLEAAEEAAGRGVRIHTVSVGTTRGGTVPGLIGGAPSSSAAQPRLLREVARAGGGRFAAAEDTRALSTLLSVMKSGSGTSSLTSADKGNPPPDPSLLCALLAFPILLLERGARFGWMVKGGAG